MIVLLPVVFKLIGKALEQSANVNETPQRVDHVVSERRKKPVADHKKTAAVAPEASVDDAINAEPVEDKKKNEKIDPKKLVLYSEIMNRKY